MAVLTKLQQHELIVQHRPLVEQVLSGFAHRYPGLADRDELRSAGLLGLVEAARRFDPSHEVPFGGFAVRRIRGAMLDVLRGGDWAPRSVREESRQVEATREHLANRGGATDDASIATELGMDRGRIRELREDQARGALRSLDNWVDRGSLADRLSDHTFAGPEEALENREMRGYVRDALASLSDRHRVVVVGVYLEGRSFEELAEMLDVTKSRVSQLRAEAIESMRGGIERQFSNAEPVRPKGRVAIRKARYAAAIADRSSWQDRLREDERTSAHPRATTA
ncbi:MAG: sigma-70 family RNA polymerase sigma factor [Acidimicrobiales bacterium]